MGDFFDNHDVVDETDCYNHLCREDVLKCPNGDPQRRKRTISNGVVIHVIQCMKCGRKTSTGIKKDASNPPDFDPDLEFRYWQNAQKAYADQKESELQERRRKYHEYLNTAEWRKKRDTILKRNPVCQGCLINYAHEVHHLTYDHIFDEFAFELVSLCSECHRRIHNA